MEEIASSLNRLNRQDKAKELIYLLEQSKLSELPNKDTVDNDAEIYSSTELAKAQRAIEASITHYRHARYAIAIQELQKALNLYPKHTGIQLNLLQVLLVAFETDRRKTDELSQAKQIIDRLSYLTNRSKSYERYQRLIRRYELLNTST